MCVSVTGDSASQQGTPSEPSSEVMGVLLSNEKTREVLLTHKGERVM